MWIDRGRPFIFIKFDHAGPRKPAIEGEGSEGIWLRLLNNCNVPITVSTFDLGTGDPGLGVNYAVVQMGGSPVTTTHPAGYSFHVVTSSVINPGKNFLFSIPRNHLSADWHIQVRFEFALPEPRLGIQPYGLVSYSWTDLPQEVRDRP